MNLNLDYIAGCIDCNGSFSISCTTANGRSGNNIRFIFTVNFRQMAQYDYVLEAIQSAFGVGKIYDHTDGMKTWQTTTPEDSLTVAKKILPYLKIKYSICENFIEALEFWIASEYPDSAVRRRKGMISRPKSAFFKMMEYAEQLNDCTQTRTARANRKDKYDEIRKRIELLKDE